MVTISAAELIPEKWLAQAEINLGAHDRLIYLGSAIPADQPLPPASAYFLTVKRAVFLTIHTLTADQSLETAADTVGEALREAGFELHAADLIDPPSDTPLVFNEAADPLIVNYTPSREFTLTIGNEQTHIRSAAATVGQALAGSGYSLVGLDASIPPESAPLPADGKIRVKRISETVALTQESIPYGTRTELSADLELDQQGLLQGGEAGLKVTRLRSRIEDGEQVSQESDGESLVRPPQDRILGIGTKVVIKTAEVDGVSIEYWRALTLYATPYHPCDAAGKCYYDTSMGTKVRQGEVALVYPWYLLLAGERVYVPGYGSATIEDNNGANTERVLGHLLDRPRLCPGRQRSIGSTIM